MAFQLKAHESVSAGIKRVVRRDIERTIELLGAKTRPHPGSAAENEAVHEARKSFKRARAALRMVRDDLGDDVYHEENFRLRDAARPLTEVRDAQVLIETWQAIRAGLTEPVDPAVLAKVHDALVAHQRAVVHRVLRQDKAFAAVTKAAEGALGGIAEWTVDRDGWAALEGGLRRVYRTGRRALALAEETPSVENLHELRKQAKYLWHGLQLLDAPCGGRVNELGDRAHELSRILGGDHDLAVLRLTLAADPLPYGGHAVLKDVFALVDRRRVDLERQAIVLARAIYPETPAAFTSRIGAYWPAPVGSPDSRAI